MKGLGLLVQSGLGTGEEEKEPDGGERVRGGDYTVRDGERRRERVCLMEERENKRLRLTGLRGVNLSCAMHMTRTRVKY